MALSVEAATESLKRVMVSFSWNASDSVTYIQAVVEACGWMDPYKFDAACKEVAKTCGQWKPKPRDFAAAYKKLAEKLGWENAASTEVCDSCGGFRFLEHYVRCPAVYGDAKVVTAASPCPRCNAFRSSAKKDGEVGNPRTIPATRDEHEQYMGTRTASLREIPFNKKQAIIELARLKQRPLTEQELVAKRDQMVKEVFDAQK